MGEDIYRYTFSEEADMEQVEDTLLLSLIVAEAMHGRSRVILDTKFRLEKAKGIGEIDGGTLVGQDMARTFTGLLTAEFGEGAFVVSRIHGGDK